MKPTNLDLTQLGLSTEQVEQSRRQFGYNLLTPPKRPSLWKLYFEKYKDPIIRILLIAAVLSLAIGLMQHEYVETIGILVAIFLATTIGFYFEYDAQKRFEILNALGQEELITVVRDGKVTQIPRSELVVGDIVILEQGVEVPADGILLEAINLDVNESTLTGEPICHKTIHEEHFVKDATYPSNKVMRSTMIVDGHGIIRVEAVGDQTEIGHVAKQATKFSDVQTPLNQQLNRLAQLINRFAFAISIAIFVICTVHGLVSYFRELLPGQDVDALRIAKMLLQYFMLAVTLIVMAVPEGLPMAVTLSLALNMRRMLKTNNLVRKMHACETMGAITVICTDKTGTLTQNHMEVTNLRFEDADRNLLFENIASNSTAHLEQDGDGIGVGNPTECALLQHMRRVGEDYAKWRQRAVVESQLSFSTERKYMATIVDSAITGNKVLYVKGAPEIVMNLCDMSEELTTQVNQLLEKYQQAAMRTLSFAYRELPADTSLDCQQLVEAGHLRFLGITAIMDPVRPEVPEAVNTCRNAGVCVKIVTGDNAGTAIEIAKLIGLWTEHDGAENMITGSEFSRLSDEEALERVVKLKVMSRARPMDKQRLVMLLQRNNEVVAVTGDGTNDAPALNYAQVGLSMGSGTSVAKEASDITLIDDSFQSIATAVMWGRSLYKNIQRFLAFQLIVSITALFITVAGAFMNTELPLTVTQILWVNLIMDTFAALALSTIPPSPNVMSEKPRKASDFILSPSLKRVILTTSICFFVILMAMLLYFNRWGLGSIDLKELTIFFTTFVMLQFWNLLNARSIGSDQSVFSNLNNCRGLLLVLLLILLGQILIVQIGGPIFRTTPLELPVWLAIIGTTSLVLWVSELIRLIRRKLA